MSGHELHVRTEFHQVMNLTMTVRMEQDQIIQVIIAPFAAFDDVVRMNTYITIEAFDWMQTNTHMRDVIKAYIRDNISLATRTITFRWLYENKLPGFMIGQDFLGAAVPKIIDRLD
jgi:hypothetical protein